MLFDNLILSASVTTAFTRPYVKKLSTRHPGTRFAKSKYSRIDEQLIINFLQGVKSREKNTYINNTHLVDCGDRIL